MCGIVGYVGRRQAVDFLLPALRRLEYRGYDSAGVATVNGAGVEVVKTAGRIAALERLVEASRPKGRIGIGHTRWATHGGPTDVNAHPHLDCRGRIAVVHNGIIENYRELRRALAAEGHRFRSQTDSEVIAHLVERHGAAGLLGAVVLAAREMTGAFALACVSEDEPGLLVAARRGGSPLVLGRGEGESFLASDIPALLRETREVVVLDEGEAALLTPDGIEVRTDAGDLVARPPTRIPWDEEAAEKAGHPHFMRKEIFEQPEAVRATLRGLAAGDAGAVEIPELGLTDQEIVGLTRLCFVGCGTSYHAGLVGAPSDGRRRDAGGAGSPLRPAGPRRATVRQPASPTGASRAGTARVVSRNAGRPEYTTGSGIFIKDVAVGGGEAGPGARRRPGGERPSPFKQPTRQKGVVSIRARDRLLRFRPPGFSPAATELGVLPDAPGGVPPD